jgi:hypothetical protein
MYDISPHSSQKRNVSDKVVQKNKKTYFIFNNLFWISFRFWDNVEEYGTARQATDANTMRRMRFAWWVTKATHTRSMQ